MHVHSSRRYNSPLVQVILVSFVCFATVGMFSAVGNLGAGGTQSITLSDITSAVLYALFALTGLVAGSFNNIFGPRVTLFCGSLGYALYLAALWVYQEKAQSWFLIFSGAVLGACAALLWTAQGCIMLSYPLEKEKGRSFSIFWAIFNCGSLMGGLIALGINIKQGGLNAVKTSTYIAFFAIIMVGVAATWTLLPPNRVVRTDGTLVKVQKNNTVRQEVSALLSTLKKREILLLLPMFFASNVSTRICLFFSSSYHLLTIISCMTQYSSSTRTKVPLPSSLSTVLLEVSTVSSSRSDRSSARCSSAFCSTSCP